MEKEYDFSPDKVIHRGTVVKDGKITESFKEAVKNHKEKRTKTMFCCDEFSSFMNVSEESCEYLVHSKMHYCPFCGTKISDDFGEFINSKLRGIKNEI